jgi:monoamine oxidase
MIDFSRHHLSALFGSATHGSIVRAITTGWSLDRLIGGSYSAARPGRAAARDVLAAPLGERLYFAGEATSREAYSTAHGAYHSGRAAIEAVAGGPGASAW